MRRKLNAADRAGFTLIELIVVIAILAILSGVATVGYSAYVKSADEAADRQIISDVEQALIMGAYTNNYPAGSVVGYVVLNEGENAECMEANPNDEINDIDVMMQSAFGPNWKEELQLRGDFFTSSDASAILSAINGQNKDYFASVPNSSFYNTEGSTDDLAAKVDEIASAFKGILGDENAHKFSNFWGSDFGATVNQEGLDIKDSQTAANLTVMAAANAICNDTGSHTSWIDSWKDDTKEPKVNASQNGYVAPLVMNYAKYVSYVSYINNPQNCDDEDLIIQVNSEYDVLVSAMNNLANQAESSSYISAFNDAMNEFERDAINVDRTYYEKWQKDYAETDAKAFIASMSAVNALEDTYVSKDKANVLNQQNAFTNFGAADILDTMVNYASLTNLPDSGYVIVLSINADGRPVVTPTVQGD